MSQRSSRTYRSRNPFDDQKYGNSPGPLSPTSTSPTTSISLETNCFETFYGQIETTTDALLVFQASELGILKRVQSRLNDEGKKELRSGSVFVYDEEESGIKRWTDGKLWSPSRIQGNFLVYRELEKKYPKRKRKDERRYVEINGKTAATGSKGTYIFDDEGLIKRTISASMNGKNFHLVAYFRKEDVAFNRLQVPRNNEQLSNLQISEELKNSPSFRKKTVAAADDEDNKDDTSSETDDEEYGNADERSPPSRPEPVSYKRRLPPIVTTGLDSNSTSSEISASSSKSNFFEINTEKISRHDHRWKNPFRISPITSSPLNQYERVFRKSSWIGENEELPTLEFSLDTKAHSNILYNIPEQSNEEVCFSLGSPPPPPVTPPRRRRLSSSSDSMFSYRKKNRSGEFGLPRWNGRRASGISTEPLELSDEPHHQSPSALSNSLLRYSSQNVYHAKPSIKLRIPRLTAFPVDYSPYHVVQSEYVEYQQPAKQKMNDLDFIEQAYLLDQFEQQLRSDQMLSIAQSEPADDFLSNFQFHPSDELFQSPITNVNLQEQLSLQLKYLQNQIGSGSSDHFNEYPILQAETTHSDWTLLDADDSVTLTQIEIPTTDS